jgi:hypothetical protein
LGALAAGIAGPASAQDQRLQAIQREIQDMRRQYDVQLEQMRRDYETRLQEMEQRLKAAEGIAASAESRAAQASQAAQPQAAPAGARGAAAQASAFNPAIGVILDGKYGVFTKSPSSYRIRGFALGDTATPGDRGFAINESELNFSANIDPVLYGNLTLSVSREDTISVEEGFLQTTSLPYGFTLRAGRFFSGIGYMNEQHAHTWDFADTALPYRAFLNTQYGDDGVQLRWLAPTDFFLEFGGEAFRGDAFPAANHASRWAGATSLFGHAGTDIGESHSLRGGLSWLRTKAASRETDADVFTGDGDTVIADAVYKWAPNGNPVNTNAKLQGEYFLRRESGAFNGLDYSGTQTGWYLQGIYQFMPQWRIGVRHDEVHANDPGLDFAGTALDTLGGVTPKRNSIMMDYSTSEFGRFRVQYNNDESRPKTDHQFILQYTVSLGAHGAHQY